jgi:plasmid maintenance system antidote protein VapI
MMAIPRDPNRMPPPMHPGEILREEFMTPRGVSSHALALALRVPSTRISEIVKLWMNLQSSYELACVERDLAGKIRREVERRAA